MRLPEIILSPDGLTVENAGAELLVELLSAFDRASDEQGAPADEYFAPGLSRSRISDDLAEIGLSSPDELLVWWSWHNGLRSARQISYHDQLDLGSAIQLYLDVEIGTDWDYQWHPDWIRTSGTGNIGGAVSCAPGSRAPLVRFVSPEYTGTQPGETARQVVSLCTPITWALTGIRDGWRWWDTAHQFWEEDLNRIPTEWKITQLA